LQEILPGVTVQLPGDGPAVPQDHEVAIRLARAAYERSGGVVEGVTLATTLAWTGATASAESVLAELAARAGSIDDRIRLALGLAWVRFWGRYHVEDARAGLTEMAAVAETAGCDPSLLADIYQDLAGIALNTAHPAAALAYAERSAAAEGVELALGIAAAPAAAALVYLGRCGEALALVERAVPAAHERGQPMAVANLLVARAGALARRGDLDQARELLEWLRDVALSEGLLGATAIFGVILGEVLLRQGRPASAGRIFRDSSGLLAEHDLFGYRPWALAGLARARALSGEEESAAAALDEARRTQPVGRHFDMSHFLAEIELHRTAGRPGAALNAARAGAEWARASGMVSDEAQCLEAWVRVAPSVEVADRLAELTRMTDSNLVGALAEHARGMVASDPATLLGASARFAEMSAWWLASEAAVAAADILARRNEPKAAKAAARTAAGFADRCEGVRVPKVDVSSGPVRLTRREQEIATLAATGRSSLDIAASMYLSPRTVENHLYHVYVKLGVTDRASLAAALGRAPSPE
jgi:DNA-binding NarL/FixJ family response regulator